MITHMQDFSGYDGTVQTAPAITSYTIPSYCVFSDRHYPANYTPHPHPPPPISLVTSTPTRRLTAEQVQILNSHIQLINTQKAPLIDHRFSVYRGSHPRN